MENIILSIITLGALFYLYKKQKSIKVVEYIAISFFVLLLLDLPFLFSNGFIHMVLLNPKQTLLFDTFYSIGTLKILLPIAAILIWPWAICQIFILI